MPTKKSQRSFPIQPTTEDCNLFEYGLIGGYWQLAGIPEPIPPRRWIWKDFVLPVRRAIRQAKRDKDQNRLLILNTLHRLIERNFLFTGLRLLEDKASFTNSDHHPVLSSRFNQDPTDFISQKRSTTIKLEDPIVFPPNGKSPPSIPYLSVCIKSVISDEDVPKASAQLARIRSRIITKSKADEVEKANQEMVLSYPQAELQALEEN